MWISEIFLENFGAFSGVRITDLGPGPNILVGANEAGKSTVLEFIRSMFFGFAKKKGKTNIYETPDLVPRKGRLSVVMTNGTGLQLDRMEKRGRREGILTVTDKSGTSSDAASKHLFESGMARGVYESLFAFDLEQLRTLDRENLRAKILGAALGSTRINPVEVLNKIEGRMKTLVKRSVNEERSMWALQTRIHHVETALRDVAGEPDRYAALKRELAETENERNSLASRIREAEESLEAVNKYIRYEEDWKSLQAVDLRAEELADASVFPADGVVRFERNSERLQAAEQAKAELERRIEHSGKHIEELTVDTILLEQADDIRRLSRTATTLAKRTVEIANLEAKAGQARIALDKDVDQLGPDWTVARVQATDTSLVVENEISRFVESRRLAEERFTDLGRKLAEQRARTRSLDGKISTLRETIERLSPSCKGFLDPDQRSFLGKWKEHHSRQGLLQERILEKQDALGKLTAELKALKQDMDRLSENPGTAIGAVHGLLILVLLLAPGLVGMLFNFRFTSEVSYPLHVVCGGYMVVAVLGFVGWKLLRERELRARARREWESLREKAKAVEGEASRIDGLIGRFRAQEEHLGSLQSEIGQRVLRNPSAGERDVAEAERRSNLAEEPVRKRRSVQDALDSYGADMDAEREVQSDIENKLKEAQKEFDQVNARLHEFLKSHAFDPGIEPETARTLIRALRQVKADLRRLSEQEQELELLKNEWQSFVDEARALAHVLDKSFSEEASPVEQVEEWSRLEREAGEASAERKSLVSTIDECRIRLEVEESNVEKARTQISALLEKARASDEEAFRDLALRHGQLHGVLEQRKALIKGLISGLRFSDEESMRRAMEAQDWEANGNTAARLQSELHRLREEAEDSANRSGGLEKEIETLEAQEETEELLADKEHLLVRMNESAQEWVRMKAASEILRETIQVYEREKQPAVLEKSSEIFERMTGGAFSKVLMPFDEDGLKVERHDGTLTTENHLSRGTLEQLYLAMRLSHLKVYHGSGGAYPVVLDDILVNFDPERARRTARELVAFSEETRIQILFFTCHPHMADLFPEHAARHTMC